MQTLHIGIYFTVKEMVKTDEGDYGHPCLSNVVDIKIMINTNLNTKFPIHPEIALPGQLNILITWYSGSFVTFYKKYTVHLLGKLERVQTYSLES